MHNPAALAEGALSGFHLAFLVATILIGLAAISATLIRDQDAASTIRRLANVPKPTPADEALLPQR